MTSSISTALLVSAAVMAFLPVATAAVLAVLTAAVVFEVLMFWLAGAAQ